MSEEKKGKTEESMEEILHSIRDIIAEEDDDIEADKEDSADGDAADDTSEVLELTDVVEETAELPPEEPADVLDDIDAALGNDDTAEASKEDAPESIEETSPPPEAEENVDEAEPPALTDTKEPEKPPAQEEAPQTSAVEIPAEPASPQETATLEGLVSPDTAIATSTTLQQLINSIPRPTSDAPQFRGGHTIEDLTIEALKPMLKEWLDENLQVVVEDLLQKEIRKLIPKD